MQYFIGVQLDGSEHVEPLRNSIPEATAEESEKLVRFSFFFLHYTFWLYEYWVYISLFVTISLMHKYHQVKQTAENVNEAVKELPDANLVNY